MILAKRPRSDAVNLSRLNQEADPRNMHTVSGGKMEINTRIEWKETRSCSRRLANDVFRPWTARRNLWWGGGKKIFCFFFLSRKGEKIKKKKKLLKKNLSGEFRRNVENTFFLRFHIFRPPWCEEHVEWHAHFARSGRDDIGFVYIYPRVVGRSRRYCNTWPTRGKAGASSWVNSQFQKSV